MSISELLGNWAGGVNTSAEANAIPPQSSPRARNAALYSVGVGTAAMAKRRGMSLMNATPITGSPVVLGGFEFKKLSGGSFTAYHLQISNGGRIDRLSTSGTLTTIDASGFTSGDHYPSFAAFNNLCFIVNGEDRKKYDGSSLTNFGIERPATAPTLAAGAAGTPNGTYEARVTFANSSTGAESSAGPTSSTVTVTSDIIEFSDIPTSGDAQVDTRYVYLRNTATQSQFYRALTISDNVTTTGSFNAADTTLITLGPDTAENDPPPSGVKYLAVHRGRLFVATDTNLYYSKVNTPEAFDPDAVEPVAPNDGQKITGLHAAHDLLFIFKSSAIYVLDGDAPNDWQIRLVDPDIGCVSNRSIVTIEGRTFWWSEQGPMMWIGGRAEPIGLPLISATVGADNLNFAQLGLIASAPDFRNQRILFAVPETGQTKLTAILPFNYRLNVWESDGWDPMDIGSFSVADDTNGQPWVFLGNHKGQVFKWWNADNDGVASGTKTGTFTASGTSVTTVTDNDATFDTTGGGLIERKVTILDSNGRKVGTTRPRITSNTGTSFTLATAVTGLTDAATYTYVIGGPAFEFDTYWSDFQLPFHKKRFEFLFLQMKATDASVTVYCDLAFDYDTSTGQAKGLSFTTTAPDATWDAAIWDSASYGTQANVHKRLRVGRTGKAWRARIRNYQADQAVVVLKAGMQAQRMTTRS